MSFSPSTRNDDSPFGETLTRPFGGALATKKILCCSMKALCSGSILANCLPMTSALLVVTKCELLPIPKYWFNGVGYPGISAARYYEQTGTDRETARRLANRFSGHSGRVGFVVAAKEAGAADSDIAATTWHKSLEMIKRYGET